MSLDDIMKSNAQGKKPFKRGPEGFKGKGAVKSNKRPFGKFQNKRSQIRNADFDDESEDDKSDDNTPAQPMKIITIERPRVIKAPPALHSVVPSTPAQSSVFKRLGSAGFPVKFQNLCNSVKEVDILELCGAVGEVKEASLHVDARGMGVATALFARAQDARTCVVKYNGKLLLILNHLVW